MSKGKRQETDLLPEYDFTGGVRGKYAKRFAAGSNVVVLDPDLAKRFPDSKAVNQALRSLVEVADREVRSTSR